MSNSVGCGSATKSLWGSLRDSLLSHSFEREEFGHPIVTASCQFSMVVVRKHLPSCKCRFSCCVAKGLHFVKLCAGRFVEFESPRLEQLSGIAASKNSMRPMIQEEAFTVPHQCVRALRGARQYSLRCTKMPGVPTRRQGIASEFRADELERCGCDVNTDAPVWAFLVCPLEGIGYRWAYKPKSPAAANGVSRRDCTS